jgi:hypothetical protein
MCKGTNGLQLTTTWTNVESILDAKGSETLHNIASCGKIELPCPPNAHAQWQNCKCFQWNDTLHIMEDHLYFQDVVCKV